LPKTNVNKIKLDIPFTDPEMAHLINHTASDDLIKKAAEFKKTQHYQDLEDLSQLRGNTKDPRYEEYIAWRASWNYLKFEKLHVLNIEVRPPPTTKPEDGPTIIGIDKVKEQQEQDQDAQIYEEIEKLQSQLHKKRHGPLPHYGR
jgi:hypothetical protein